MPSLSAVTFTRSSGITWDVLETILSHPRIVSLIFEASVSFALVDPYPVDKCSQISISLTHLSIADGTVWKEFGWFGHGELRSLNAVFSREAKCLDALIPATNATMHDLVLPMQSAPILSMANLSWNYLTRLSFFGRYMNSEKAEALPTLLSSLSSLQTLSLLVARDNSVSRAPILGHDPLSTTILSGLRSLTLAYPDPKDAIFSVDTTSLRHLSLRDWPRHYTKFTFEDNYTNYWASPILSSDECLSILQRLNPSQLTSLELVYEAQRSGSDDNLLRYLAHTFPTLSYLELHRYRANREEPFDYVRRNLLLRSGLS